VLNFIFEITKRKKHGFCWKTTTLKNKGYLEC